MIGFLSGSAVSVRGKRIIVATASGVGYAVDIPQRLSLQIRSKSKVELFIHQHQTTDSSRLFGFATESELEFFERLLKINGVGPKTALDLLEQPIAEIQKTIEAADAKKLAQTPGVGPKTAARIVLELRGKLTDPADKPMKKNSEIVAALESLGFKKKEINEKLADLPTEISETEAAVRWFLAN